MAKHLKNKFAICIEDDCGDLRIWKLYRLLPDTDAATEGYLRVIDESGEDYLYPASRFAMVKFAPLIEKKIMAAWQKCRPNDFCFLA